LFLIFFKFNLFSLPKTFVNIFVGKAEDKRGRVHENFFCYDNILFCTKCSYIRFQTHSSALLFVRFNKFVNWFSSLGFSRQQQSHLQPQEATPTPHHLDATTCKFNTNNPIGNSSKESREIKGTVGWNGFWLNPIHLVYKEKIYNFLHGWPFLTKMCSVFLRFSPLCVFSVNAESPQKI